MSRSKIAADFIGLSKTMTEKAEELVEDLGLREGRMFVSFLVL